MTEYPVQCFDHNGEPYGRYSNPYHPLMADTEGYEWLSEAFQRFETLADSCKLPFPSSQIDKVYEMGEVEVVWQYESAGTWTDFDDMFTAYSSTIDSCTILFRGVQYSARKVFRLLPQPVEKEPETVELLTCSCGNEGIKGVDVGQPFAPYYDTVICKSCWDKFQEWKKQEASR